MFVFVVLGVKILSKGYNACLPCETPKTVSSLISSQSFSLNLHVIDMLTACSSSLACVDMILLKLTCKIQVSQRGKSNHTLAHSVDPS